MVALLLAVYTGNHIELAARFQLGNQVRAGTEVQVAVSECAAGGGVHLKSNINVVLILDCGSGLCLEHGVDGICTLLGNKQLTADILLLRRCGRIGNRLGDGILLDLDLRNFFRHHQFQFTGIVGASGSQVALDDAHRNAGSGSRGRESKVVALRGLPVLSLNRRNCSTRFDQGSQLRPITKVQIGIRKFSAGRRIHLNRRIDGLANLHRGCRLNFKHRVDSAVVFLRNEQLSAHVLFLCRSSRVADRCKSRDLCCVQFEAIFLFHCRDNQLQFLYQIAALRILLNQTHRHAAIAGHISSKVEQLGAAIVHALHHRDGAALGQSILQLSMAAKIQISVRRADIQCCVQDTIAANCGSALHCKVAAQLVTARIHRCNSRSALLHGGGCAISNRIQVRLFRFRLLRLCFFGFGFVFGLRFLWKLLFGFRFFCRHFRFFRRCLRCLLHRGFRRLFRGSFGSNRWLLLLFLSRYRGFRFWVWSLCRLYRPNNLLLLLKIFSSGRQCIARQHRKCQQECNDSCP